MFGNLRTSSITVRLLVSSYVGIAALTLAGCGGGGSEVYDPIQIDLQTLQKSEDLEARKAAALRLSSQTKIDETAVPALLKIAKNDAEDDTIRRRVIAALGKSDSDEAANGLAAIMDGLPKNSPLRTTIAAALNNLLKS